MADKQLDVISVDEVRAIIKSEIESGEYKEIVQSFQNKEHPVAISVIGRRMIRSGLLSKSKSSAILHLSRLMVQWSYYYCSPEAGRLKDEYKTALLGHLLDTQVKFVHKKVLAANPKPEDKKVYFSLVDTIMARFIYDGFSYYRFKTCMMRRMRMMYGVSSSQFNYNLYMADICRSQYGRWLEYKLNNPEANVNVLLDHITTDISAGALELMMFNVHSVTYVLKEPNGEINDILSVLNDDCSDAMVGYGYTSNAWDIVHNDAGYSMESKFIYHNLANEVFKSRMYYQLNNDVYKTRAQYNVVGDVYTDYDHTVLKNDLCSIITTVAKQSKSYKEACDLINDIGLSNKSMTEVIKSMTANIDPNEATVNGNDISKVEYIGKLAKYSETTDKSLRALSAMVLMNMIYGLNA